MQKIQVKTSYLVQLYTEKHLTMQEIGDMVGMSKAAVSKRLRAVNLDLSKGTWVEMPCGYCGSMFKAPRSRAKNGAKYCSVACYGASISKPTSYNWCNGMRLARAVVSQHFKLSKEHVVHHLDHDNRNNDLANLIVFESMADHASFHRGGKTKPIWSGSTLRP